jgi:hypothetical protein
MEAVFRILNRRLGRWAYNKYKRFKRQKSVYAALKWLRKNRKRFSLHFSALATWLYALGLITKSRVSREVHARFCERLGGVIPPCLLDLSYLFLFSSLIQGEIFTFTKIAHRNLSYDDKLLDALYCPIFHKLQKIHASRPVMDGQSERSAFPCLHNLHRPTYRIQYA